MNSTIFECAAAYVYNVPRPLPQPKLKRETKVEPVSKSNTGKRFNYNAGTKANHSTIDICI